MGRDVMGTLGRRGRASLIGSVVAVTVVLAAARPVAGQDSATDARQVARARVGAVPDAVRGRLGRRMDELARRATVFGFSGQVLVASEGRVLLHRAYGYADPGSGRRMTLRTPVGVASVSKQFAAAAVMALAARGLLRPRDSLSDHLDGVPEDKRNVTIHQLLTHSSGVRSAYSEDFEPATREELIRGILQTPLAFEPGTEWSYSTAGYNLVAAVVESVTGSPYGTALRELLFEPAGLQRTGLMSGGPWSDGEVARAHVGWIDRGSPDVWPRNWRNFGAGDVVTTAADLYRWDRALRSGAVLRPSSVERMTSVHRELGEEVGYGYGFFVHHPEGGPTVVEHGGDAELGYNASYYRYPDEGHLVLITSNVRTPQSRSLRHALGLGLEQLLRGRDAELPPDAAFLDRATVHRLAGSYVLDDAPDGRAARSSFHLVSDGRRLWLTATGQAAVDVLVGEPSSASGEAGARGNQRANDRTRRLLERLIQRADSSGYADALTTDGIRHLEDYLGEWHGLVEARGPFQDFRILGSRPFGPDGRSTVARLRFRQGDVAVSYLWTEAGAGRLAGTFVHQAAFRPPLGLAVGRGAGGGFVAHDPITGDTVRFDVERGGSATALRFHSGDGSVVATARRTGVAGWTPPFGG